MALRLRKQHVLSNLLTGQPRPSAAAFILLLLLVAVAPFPYGAILPGGSLSIELIAFLCAALAFVRLRGRRIGAGIIPLLSLLAIAMLGVLQLVPLSDATLQAISPASAFTYRQTAEVLRLFGKGTLIPAARISIAPSETASTILLVLAYAAAFFMAIELTDSTERRRAVIAVFLASCVIHICWATIAQGGEERIHGAFVNPNHLAGYLEIALMFAFAVVWRELLVNRERGAGNQDLAQRFEKRFWPLAWRILLWGIIAAGIGVTKSRGGISMSVIATLVMLLLAIAHIATRKKRRAAVVGTAALVAGLAFVALALSDAPLLRFLASDPRDPTTNTRTQLWKISIEAWRLFPWLGSGLGTFREAFRRAQPREMAVLVEQAHNDSLQVLVTGGIVGLACGILAFGSMFFLLVRAWRRQEHREESAVALAGFGALLALTLHGIVEFNMSLPAIPMTLAAMLGVSWSAARHDQQATSRENLAVREALPPEMLTSPS